MVTAGFAATRVAWPGMVWAIAASLYLLVLSLLFNARVRSVYACWPASRDTAEGG